MKKSNVKKIILITDLAFVAGVILYYGTEVLIARSQTQAIVDETFASGKIKLSQAIQLFGRGVRLKGYRGCLKRSHKLDNCSVQIPKHIEMLETLSIFGIKAQYMEDFKKHLELEEMPTNDNVHDFTLPVISRYNEVKDRKLQMIKVRGGANHSVIMPTSGLSCQHAPRGVLTRYEITFGRSVLQTSPSRTLTKNPYFTNFFVDLTGNRKIMWNYLMGAISIE